MSSNFKRQIPNMLSVLRLFMVPLFVVGYFKYKAHVAAIIYVTAWITDALDGYLARRNGWITDVGKILDPIADKIMQLAAAFCFALENYIYFIVVFLLFLKEFGMLYASVRIKKERNIVVAASWFGKLSTVILFVCAFLRLMIRSNATLDIVVVAIMVICMSFALSMYYFKEFKGKYNLNVFNKAN
ncbi:MAG: CDP-alcohol phosphatidyltransferase family protein [Ruminococcaceae bacterium]|nr:CDP-alcohol phosphatidyltransferase family protein [Oscillospiraceae bacterium]